MNIWKYRPLQFIVETLFIAVGGYFLIRFFPGLPWWSGVLFAGLVAFALNTSVSSFFAGLLGLGLLWGLLAYQINSANEGLLAAKVGALFDLGPFLNKTGGVTPLRLVLLTGLLGGLVGGLGAMTGALGRKALQRKKETTPLTDPAGPGAESA